MTDNTEKNTAIIPYSKLGMLRLDWDDSTSWYLETIPDSILKTCDPAQIEKFLIERIGELQFGHDRVENEAASVQTLIRVAQGAVLFSAREALGTDGLNMMLDKFRISQRTAYNFLGLYIHFRELGKEAKEFIASLGPTKAVVLCNTLKNPNIRLEEGSLIYEDGEISTTVSLDEMQSATAREFPELISRLETLKKEKKNAERGAEKKKSIYEKSIAMRDEKIAQLEKKLRDHELYSADCPEINMLNELQKISKQYKSLMTHICQFKADRLLGIREDILNIRETVERVHDVALAAIEKTYDVIEL